MKKALSVVIAVLLALAFGAISFRRDTSTRPLERLAAVATTTIPPTTTTQAPPPPPPSTTTTVVHAAPKPLPAPKTVAAPATHSGCHAGWAAWDYIRAYESGGTTNPAGTNESGGGYYQIEPGTWNHYQGYPSAESAPYDVQTQKAQAIQADRGWKPWTTAYHARACGAI